METTLKTATLSDLNSLIEFMREYYEYDNLTFEEGIARQALKQILQDDSLGLVWLIYSQEKAIGYIILTLGYSLEYHGRDAFVDELYIRDNYRGYGIGTKVLQFIENICASLGVQALHLEVERQNTKAQSLYRKLGFEDHDRYLMTKWISIPS